jgi:hypothetical protein
VPLGPHRGAAGHRAGRAAAGAQEVRGVVPPLEAEQVRAEQALDDLPPPWQLGEDLVARERGVREEADAQVAAPLPYHPRHQLKLVVVHPDRRARPGLVGRGAREAPVDSLVALPPAALEGGPGDHVVI